MRSGRRVWRMGGFWAAALKELGAVLRGGICGCVRATGLYVWEARRVIEPISVYIQSFVHKICLWDTRYKPLLDSGCVYRYCSILLLIGRVL